MNKKEMTISFLRLASSGNVREAYNILDRVASRKRKMVDYQQ